MDDLSIKWIGQYIKSKYSGSNQDLKGGKCVQTVTGWEQRL